jgi:hypothetical protein
VSHNIDKLLDTEDDFELCNELFKRVDKQHGNDLDVSKYNDAEQVVILVWHSLGIIDNGGIQYLFEGTFKGDPYFVRTAKAFWSIKADVCAEAIETALKKFPDSKPPSDIQRRLTIYQAVNTKERQAIDWQFFSESKQVRHLLAKYIREHRAEFKHLK